MRARTLNITTKIATNPIRQSSQAIVAKTSASTDMFINKKKLSLAARKIFAKCKEMDLKEYKRLNANEKAILRLEIEKLPKEDYQDDFIIHKKADVDDVITLAKRIKGNLDEKYGEGKYVFCSIGSSGSLFSNLYKSIGMDSTICRYSYKRDIKEFQNNGEKNVKTYEYFKKHLEKMGLSADKIKKSDKTFVFIDYVDKGDCLRSFQEIIEDPIIGIKSDNVKFENMNEFVHRPKGDTTSRIKWNYDEYMYGNIFRQYVMYPPDKSNHFIQKQYLSKPIEPTKNEIKLFRFAMFDKVLNEKAFKK